jgi:RNA polymerase sigma-70 factor, ECF subfamily
VTTTTRWLMTQPLTDDFERMFLENYDLVYRAAFSITGNAPDAEDVLQTLFLRLLKRENPVQVEKNPRAYLYRSAVNGAIDLVRARPQAELVVSPEVLSANAGEEPSDKRSAEIWEWLNGALAKLHPKEAEVFLLRHIEGYTNMEIARLIGVTRGTVAVTLFRARVRLKKSIRRRFGDAL